MFTAASFTAAPLRIPINSARRRFCVNRRMGNNSSRAKAYLETDVEERRLSFANTSTPSPPAAADPLADLKQQRRQQRDASPGAPTTKQWNPDSGPVPPRPTPAPATSAA